MEYKVAEIPTSKVAHVDLGGWVKKSSKTWHFVTSHSYDLPVDNREITVDDFLVKLLSPNVSATGRSDACGRGPGILLGADQSKILDTRKGCQQLLRLFVFGCNLSSSSKKLPPYSQMNLCPRGDQRLLFDVFRDDPVIIRGFLDAESPNESVKGRTCCVIS